MTDIITISDRGKSQLVKLMSESNVTCETHYLRVGVKGGGCSGLSYELGFDIIKNESDNLVKTNPINILVDKKSFLYLFGTELDFSDGLNGKGFQFINPNASRTCGCGESFAI